MVKAITTGSRTRNTTLIEGAKKQPPLRMDISTDNTQGQRSVKKLQTTTVRKTKRYLSKGNAVNGSLLQVHHEKIAQQNSTQT